MYRPETVIVPSRIRFPRPEIAEACRLIGPILQRALTVDVDAVRLLWAIAGAESGFGENCTPRHEMGYCTGRYSSEPHVVELAKLCGCSAHSSYGPWQTMLASTTTAVPENFADPKFSCRIAGVYLQEFGVCVRHAKTVAELASVYNTGGVHAAGVNGEPPSSYVQKVLQFYGHEAMP